VLEAVSTWIPGRVRGVAELVHEVGELLTNRFAVCTVRGELSGFARAASGHCYFNLKDADADPGAGGAAGTALLRCAMFRRAAGLLDFSPADGQLVQLRGRLGVYEPRGELQLVVEAMQQAGAGALYEQFLRLRARMQAQGWFDAARKRPLPPYPQAVGVVTSLAAAALQDVLSALIRRAPHVRVVVYPSMVQGTDAPVNLVQAIHTASQRAEVDVLIVCRGGGSLEDLWAFNDERVVQAIVNAQIPVVCGVGHETDVTLADLAADLRAPTPTAAAELVAATRQSCWDVLDRLAQALQRRIHHAFDAQAQRLDRTALRLSRPSHGLHHQTQRLNALAHRLAMQAPRTIQVHGVRLAQLHGRLQHGLSLCLGAKNQRLSAASVRLQALNPEKVLARGYAWLSDDTGRAVSSVQQLTVGESIQAVLSDGVADVQVVRLPPSI
jgi:exodeoxyribonuclease VII large subunit